MNFILSFMEPNHGSKVSRRGTYPGKPYHISSNFYFYGRKSQGLDKYIDKVIWLAYTVFTVSLIFQWV